MRISFRDAWQFVARGFIPAILVAIVAALAAFFVSKEPESIYRATAVLLATRPGTTYFNDSNLIEPSQLDPSIYRSAVLQGGILEQVLEGEFGATPETGLVSAWRQRVRIRVDDSLISGLIYIDVDDVDQEVARRLANSISTGLLAWDRDRVLRNVQTTAASLDQKVQVLGAQIAEAEAVGAEREAQLLRAARDQRVAQLEAAEALGISAVVVGLLEPFRQALVDPKPVNNRSMFSAVVAFVLSFVGAYVALFLYRAVDPRIRSAEDLFNSTGLTAVAELPAQERKNQYESAIDRLATYVQSVVNPAAPTASTQSFEGKIVTVTSPSQSREGSLLALHLATTYANAGWQVLLVDADLNEGTVSRALGVADGKRSLTRFLRGATFDAPTKMIHGVGKDLHFVAAGDTPVTGASVLLARSAPELLETWKTRYQLIIVDGMSMATSAGALALVREADAVVLAVRTNRSRIREVQAAKAELALVSKAPVMAALSS